MTKKCLPYTYSNFASPASQQATRWWGSTRCNMDTPAKRKSLWVPYEFYQELTAGNLSYLGTKNCRSALPRKKGLNWVRKIISWCCWFCIKGKSLVLPLNKRTNYLFFSSTEFDKLAAMLKMKESTLQATVKQIHPILNSCLVERWWTPEKRVRPRLLTNTPFPYVGLLTNSMSAQIHHPRLPFAKGKDFLRQEEWLLCLEKGSNCYRRGSSLCAVFTTWGNWI